MLRSNNFKDIINIKKPDKEIQWLVVVLFALKAWGYSQKILFLIYAMLLLAIIVKSGRVIIPKIKGLFIYVCIFFVAMSIGMMKFPIGLVEKDVYYYLPNIVVILLGFYLAFYYSEKKSIIKTLCVSGLVSSIIGWGRLISNPSNFSDFNKLRSSLSGNIYEIAIIVAIVIFFRIICKECVFSKIKDIGIILVLTMQVLLSMGRTQIIILVCGLILIMFEAMLFYEDKYKKIKTILQIFIISGLAIAFVMFVVPEDMTDNLLDKFENTTTEIDATNEYNSTEDVMKNWRGYETQCAERQWKNYNLLEQIIGGGLGKAVSVQFVPYTWKRFDMISGNNVPLLHNGYYTTLIKEGILGVIALVWIFLSNAIYIFTKKSFNEEQRKMLIVLSAASIGVAIQTYVMRGIVSQETCLSWALMVGWINYDIKRKIPTKQS